MYLELAPRAPFVLVGDTFQVTATGRDRSFAPVPITDPITWYSDAPDVVTVSATGVVTAAAPGSAALWALVSTRSGTRRGLLTVDVHPIPVPGELLLVSGLNGWQPSVAHAEAGATVRWSPGSRGGAPNTTLYLMDAGWQLIESFDLRSGSATYRFHEYGTYHYCSGGCWDPPDFGTIHVDRGPVSR